MLPDNVENVLEESLATTCSILGRFLGRSIYDLHRNRLKLVSSILFERCHQAISTRKRN